MAIGTAQASDWLTRTYAGRGDMPLTEAQKTAFRAREHGWVPEGGFRKGSSIGKLSPTKAHELLVESGDESDRKAGQKAALKRARK